VTAPSSVCSSCLVLRYLLQILRHKVGQREIPHGSRQSNLNWSWFWLHPNLRVRAGLQSEALGLPQQHFLPQRFRASPRHITWQVLQGWGIPRGPQIPHKHLLGINLVPSRRKAVLAIRVELRSSLRLGTCRLQCAGMLQKHYLHSDWLESMEPEKAVWPQHNFRCVPIEYNFKRLNFPIQSLHQRSDS
jgi:hypothetical protein